MAIEILGSDVVGQIAAGEVLERPANLIKELVENSLDAGADHIEIEFSKGGRDVTVKDNGLGMPAPDLRLALTRFATSKIQQTSDIYKLSSFGFRGEALASVAAVSEMSLTSRTPGASPGARVESRFGQMDDPVEAASDQGTEIRVRELFRNVPARLSFMKSEAAESSQIKLTIKALALANEHVSFRIRQNSELLFYFPAEEDLVRRAISVLGCGPLYRGEATVDGVTAEVVVGSPHDTARVNRNLWFFVQGRWVQDRALGAAVMEGYRNLLMHGEYPTAVVRITCAPEEVDVNVHPTKAQVRFREPSRAFRATCRAVREILEQAPWREGESGLTNLNDGPKPRSSATARSGSESSSATRSGSDSPSAIRSVPLLPSATRSNSAASATPSFPGREFSRSQFATKSFALDEVRAAVNSLKEPSAEYDLGFKGLAPSPENASDTADAATAPVTSVTPVASGFSWGGLQIVGQVNQTYIVAQNGESMYLVDQHAAHERVVFERLRRDFADGRMEVQNLLFPLVFDFAEEEVEALHQHRQEIARLGLHVERCGPASLAVTAIPALVKEAAIARALESLGAGYRQNGGSLALERAINDIFASMACHSVIRAGQSQSPSQMQSLLAQMDEFPLSDFCPHGRPVSTRTKFRDLDREFGRIP